MSANQRLSSVRGRAVGSNGPVDEESLMRPVPGTLSCAVARLHARKVNLTMAVMSLFRESRVDTSFCDAVFFHFFFFCFVFTSNLV